MPLYHGIDIGGTKITTAIVTENGVVLEKRTGPTPLGGGTQILDAAKALILAQYRPDIVGIGIGTGGQVDSQRGIIVSATDLLPGWSGTKLKEIFERQFDIPTSVDNDVNAFAVAELLFGAARGRKCVVFLALGTGVGGALLIDGKIYTGAHWGGGEFGHILLSMEADARIDGGGHQGTLEAYASGTGLMQTWREMTGRDDASRGEDLLDMEGGPEAIAQTGRYLGYGLTSLVNALDPEMIVVGGGLAALGSLLLDPARDVLRTRSLAGPRACPVVTAALGADASVIGAAGLAMRCERSELPDYTI